jgi:hypothetical protein
LNTGASSHTSSLVTPPVASHAFAHHVPTVYHTDGSSQPESGVKTIWSFVRDFTGIIGILYRPTASSGRSEAASLGSLAESYLVSHGYTRETVEAITTAARTSTSAFAFAEVLSAHGYPRMEAEWLWDIIEHA